MSQSANQQTGEVTLALNPQKIDLPEPLTALERIAANFYWSWQPEGVELFRGIAPTIWDQFEQHPQKVLQEVGELRLWQKATDQDYLDKLARFAEKFDRYMAEPAKSFDDGPTPEHPAAYFCAEYGVHNSLPNYSGGLGILAGDHLKSASDMNVPLVAVGLLYRFGYFRQDISHDGWQKEHYNDIFDLGLAISPVHDADGQPITISVHMRGREVHARAWLANVGRISLYLLDTNLDENDEIDRLITGHLYGGDSETRIVQEKVLGIGGVRLLRKLGIEPSVFHLNEGHAAFSTLELVREHVSANPDKSFNEALDHVRQQCVFTTHTPVAAGNDVFSPELLMDCFSAEYIESLTLSQEEFLALGRVVPANTDEAFGMTPFALRMTRSANGVSEKHGEVSRELWRPMFRELREVPITHVTNGVHAPTWIAPIFQRLYTELIGDSWPEIVRDESGWATAVRQISDERIWAAHLTLKNLLVAFIRLRTKRKETGGSDTINERTDTSGLFSPDVLTIGFARRVAQYKRWDLLLSDLDRLCKIVDHPERPVQFVFAGKAHPQDRTAKTILQELMSINHDSGWQQRAVFIEDYDQEVARYLVQGVDVWMNVPRRPHEASGTSGMKAAMNGALNFSVLDGWWIEGFNENNGFAIGDLTDFESDDEIDALEAEALYSALERDVIPTFYEHIIDGIPAKWVAMMKDSIATLTPQFSSDRMVTDYINRIYAK
jgi:starch phosphorylase